MKNVLITGYSRGLGYEIAKKIYRDDIKLIGLSQNFRDCEFPIDRYEVDLSITHEVDKVADFLLKKYRKIDVLINDAGVYLDDPRKQKFNIQDLTYNILNKTINVNFYAAFIFIQKLLPIQINNGYGRIINISSGMGRLSEFDEHSYAYRLSKLMINSLSISYGKILNDIDVDVSIMSVCPGWIRTDMGTENAPESAEDAAEYISSLIGKNKKETNGLFLRKGKILSWTIK